MAREPDTQAAEELSREAERLLAEYFRIRREYNALDRDNPAHAGRRAELQGRYRELDRKYTQLVKTQDDLVEATQGPARNRADVLWDGATQSEARLNEPVESAQSEGPWIELTTPTEGAATDAMFEEALRQVGDDTPAESGAADDETESRGHVSTPFPEAEVDDFDDPAVELDTDSEDELAGTQPSFAVDALRELTEHLRSGDLDDIDRELAETVQSVDEASASFAPVDNDTPAELPAAYKPPGTASPPVAQSSPVPEPFVEIDSTEPKPIVPRPPRARRAARAAQKSQEVKAIACPSCGERLVAGTHACRYCGARLIAVDTAEGMADPVLPHLQLQLSEPKPRPHVGARAMIIFGWFLVFSAAFWLLALNTDFRIEEIHAWLNSYGMGMLRKDQSGGILGIAMILLGGTLVGVGIFATRFVRVVVSMHELARNGRVESIEKLIVEGAELDQRDERGCTPLHFAVVAKQREVVAVLAGNGADVNSHNNRGDTPLHMAVANRDHALVQYLLKKGADAETVNDGGSTLMHVAAQVGDVGMLKLFHERGLAVDQTTKVGFTPLHFAAQSGHDDAMEFLLDHGADPNAASDHGTTPIFPATRNGHLNAVRLLVDAGADYNARRGHDFESPLGIARVHKRREVYEFLESIGAED